jgi:hypothetical protein
VTVSIDPDPLFDEAEPPAKLITGGRYRLPNRDGSHRPGGWMRTTNLVSAYSDTRRLALWQARMILMGLRERQDIYEELCSMPLETMDPGYVRDQLEKLADLAQSAAKADVGRRRGDARHSMVQHLYEHDQVIGTWEMREHLDMYLKALQAHHLQAVPGLCERVIVCEELGCAGKFDNVFEDLDTDVMHIGDLKTQRMFWTMLEVRAQLAVYAHGDAMWDAERACYVDMPPVSRELGFAVHMPQEPGEDGRPRDIQVLDIDLVEGWHTAVKALEVVKDRARARSVDTMRSAIRPLPAPVEVVLSDTEAYAARFAACGSWAEGVDLTSGAKEKGLWGPELAGCAARAAARLRADRDA